MEFVGKDCWVCYLDTPNGNEIADWVPAKIVSVGDERIVVHFPQVNLVVPVLHDYVRIQQAKPTEKHLLSWVDLIKAAK